MRSGDAIGFVGLGNMGRPMSARLGAAGFRVAAFDIDAVAWEAAARNTGVDVVSTVSAVAAGTGAVILILPNSEIVRQVVLDEGLLDAMAPGSLLIDMSSSNASETRALAGPLGEQGVRFLDAPVSGGVVGARQGGDPRRRPRRRPCGEGAQQPAVGDQLAREQRGARHRHRVRPGPGGRARRGQPLERQVVVDELKLPKFVLTGAFDSGFELGLMLKDMRIATSLARRMGTPALLGEAAVEYWARAADALPDGADHTEIARWVTQRRERRPETE